MIHLWKFVIISIISSQCYFPYASTTIVSHYNESHDDVQALRALVTNLQDEIKLIKSSGCTPENVNEEQRQGRALEEDKQAERARIFYLDVARVASYNLVSHQDAPVEPGWSGDIVFEDNFDGETLDLSKWVYEEGSSGYGGNNLESYRKENVEVKDGHLVISALIQEVDERNYTSGRIRQIGPGFSYGAYVTRARLPLGKHLWPAFWLLQRTDCKYEEIDILEYRGQNPRDIEMTGHYGRNWSHVVSKGSSVLTTPFDLSADFHEYALLWIPTKLAWYFDNIKYAEVSLDPEQWRNEGEGKIPCGEEIRPFTEPSHFILNMAIGGGFFGQSGQFIMDDAKRWPKNTYEIDWVRIYQEN